jgi:predicted transcriptional regulator
MAIRVFYITKKIIDSVLTGESARKERRRKGKTLREVGYSLEVGTSYICDLEHGRKPWNERLIQKYEDALIK